MKNIFMIVSLAFLLSACSALKVDVDYDSSYNFTSKTKYAILHNVREDENSLINERIQRAIKAQLDAKGYEEVPKENADLIFVFHVNVMQRSDIRSDYQMIGYNNYGYGGAWGYRGFGGYSRTPVLVEKPSVYRWKEGRLVIDALNTKSKKIVWRGIVKDELSNGSSSSEEKTKYINSVVGKLFKKFPKD